MGKTTGLPLITGAAAEKRLRTFIAKFSPADQVRIRAARRILRQRLRGAYELPLDSAADLARPELKRLVQGACARAAAPLEGGPVRLIIRSLSSKQRPRRK